MIKDEEEIDEDKEGIEAAYDGVLHTDVSLVVSRVFDMILWHTKWYMKVLCGPIF